MAEAGNKRPSDEQALTPEMRELILRFDAKDRRDPEQTTRNGGTKKRRRRGDPPAGAQGRRASPS